MKLSQRKLRFRVQNIKFWDQKRDQKRVQNRYVIPYKAFLKEIKIPVPKNQVRASQSKSDQVRAGQIRSEQVRSGRSKSDEVRAGQSKSHEVRAGQFRSVQVRS